MKRRYESVLFFGGKNTISEFFSFYGRNFPNILWISPLTASYRRSFWNLLSFTSFGRNEFSSYLIDSFILSSKWARNFSYCKSSSDFGISKISTNSGGNLDENCQLIRNQSRWLKWRRPKERSSRILASSAGIICSAFAVLGRDRIIWTRRASAMRSRVFRISFVSVIPGRSAASKISAE